jgi:hypothetical protein
MHTEAAFLKAIEAVAVEYGLSREYVRRCATWKAPEQATWLPPLQASIHG